MAPIRDPDGGFWKPDGGAWTAPAQHISESGAVASSWTSWCEREGDRDLPDRLIPVNAADHAVVLRIATERDVDACRVHWPTLDPMGELHFSFEQMRLDGIDAIEYHENEETHWSALRGWDVDCTLWLNPEKAIAEKAVSRSREV